MLLLPHHACRTPSPDSWSLPVAEQRALTCNIYGWLASPLLLTKNACTSSHLCCWLPHCFPPTTPGLLLLPPPLQNAEALVRYGFTKQLTVITAPNTPFAPLWSVIFSAFNVSDQGSERIQKRPSGGSMAVRSSARVTRRGISSRPQGTNRGRVPSRKGMGFLHRSAATRA